MKILKITSMIIGGVAAVSAVLAAVGLLIFKTELEGLDFSTDFSLKD